MLKPFLSTTLREKPKPVRPRSAHALARSATPDEALLLGCPSLPPARSLTLKASLASAMIARWQLLCMRSACGCAQPIPSNALIAHQQPCLPPARLHGGTMFCSDAFLPIGCSDAACMLLRFVPCRLVWKRLNSAHRGLTKRPTHEHISSTLPAAPHKAAGSVDQA